MRFKLFATFCDHSSNHVHASPLSTAPGTEAAAAWSFGLVSVNICPGCIAEGSTVGEDIMSGVFWLMAWCTCYFALAAISWR